MRDNVLARLDYQSVLPFGQIAHLKHPFMLFKYVAIMSPLKLRRWRHLFCGVTSWFAWRYGLSFTVIIVRWYSSIMSNLWMCQIKHWSHSVCIKQTLTCFRYAITLCINPPPLSTPKLKILLGRYWSLGVCSIWYHNCLRSGWYCGW